MPILITFESWVTVDAWFAYAAARPLDVPHVLIDRSQCTDPFFDHFTPAFHARPLISGLCRPRKSYPIGERFIYITRVDRRVLSSLGRAAPTPNGAVYFGVAALRVAAVHPTHAAAAATFGQAPYAVNPSPSAHPPNLAHSPYPGASVECRSCITHDVHADPPRAHTALTATTGMHRAHYNFYRGRQRGLPVAECIFTHIDGRAARALDPAKAPLLSPSDWAERKMNQRGLRISDSEADGITRKIASANC